MTSAEQISESFEHSNKGRHDSSAMKEYCFREIENKWQDFWDKNSTYRAIDFDSRPKFYCLVEFPYPSGDGLHVGHPRSYTAIDILARKKRMLGFNVLFPMGFDSFGLPTENYAIKTGIHPSIITAKNIARFTAQLKSLGFSFDWERVFSTSDPEYYKWTQWLFIQFFKHGLAYKAKMPINWCISCKIGLANEEVVDGACERCGGTVEKREIEQWMLAITKYADRLIKDLGTVDFLDKIKSQQINWIGKSEGAEIDFKISGHDKKIRVFTTRPDTLFGATYMVLAPEHPSVREIASPECAAKIEEYCSKTAKMSDIERSETKEKTGAFTGAFAENPVNGAKIPVWISDYVLAGYGLGAIMAVPAHDTRDFEFAKKFGLPVKCVILPDQKNADARNISRSEIELGEACWSHDGRLVNSSNNAGLDINGLDVADAIAKTVAWLDSRSLGKATVNYKLRDWVFSRQRYWGEPIPMVHCPKCSWVPVPDEELPVLLPQVEKYEPTDTGESPLASISEWVSAPCPKCGSPARRETDTMPNWAGSSWYFIRYADPRNSKAFADPEKLKYWMPVDWYNGGMEHTTLHLLYSRFWNKFFYDIGIVPSSEPYMKRTSHGMVLGEGGEKMSKSRGNVINPDEVIAQYGADVFRLYEMFIGPFDQAAAWDTKGIVGVSRFLHKVWNLIANGEIRDDVELSREQLRVLNFTIKKVGKDIESLDLNTAVSQMMIFVNEFSKSGQISKDAAKAFVKILSPFAPHMAEELWQMLGEETQVSLSEWPAYDEALCVLDEIEILVQINGKPVQRLMLSAASDENDMRSVALALPMVLQNLNGRTPKKVICVKGRLVNIVA